MEKQIYRDCQKNHACYDGGYAIDGCREFIPCSTMKIHCQACGCHRNYHRKVPFIDLEQFPPENGLIRSSFRSLREAKRIARQRYLLPAPSSQADCEPKQRRKSKFSKGQRDAMRAFAESLGWTMMNKGRQADISRFCEVIGISRPTFKTWLNNNKKFYNKTTDSASGASSSSSKTA